MSVDNDFIEIEVGVGLDDSELISYNYLKHDDELIIKLQAWDESVVEIFCNNPILFFDRGCGETSNFCQKISNSNILEMALKSNYDNGIIPKNHPYKLYHIFDLNDQPSIEIICASIETQRMK